MGTWDTSSQTVWGRIRDRVARCGMLVHVNPNLRRRALKIAVGNIATSLLYRCVGAVPSRWRRYVHSCWDEVFPRVLAKRLDKGYWCYLHPEIAVPVTHFNQLMSSPTVRLPLQISR